MDVEVCHLKYSNDTKLETTHINLLIYNIINNANILKRTTGRT